MQHRLQLAMICLTWIIVKRSNMEIEFKLESNLKIPRVIFLSEFVSMFSHSLFRFQAAWALIVEFCSNSSIHGVRYFSERRRHWTER